MGSTALGARLLQLRQSADLTQQQMAERLGLTREAYKGYEKGNREPELSLLGRISKTFNRTTDWLLGMDTVEAPAEPLDEIAAVLRKSGWSEDRIALVLRLAEATDAENKRR